MDRKLLRSVITPAVFTVRTDLIFRRSVNLFPKEILSINTRQRAFPILPTTAWSHANATFWSRPPLRTRSHKITQDASRLNLSSRQPTDRLLLRQMRSWIPEESSYARISFPMQAVLLSPTSSGFRTSRTLPGILMKLTRCFRRSCLPHLTKFMLSARRRT